MEPITIILTIVGVLLLVGSCFLPVKESEAQVTDYDELVKRFAKRELSPEETERLRQAVDNIVSEKREEVILKTDDYLSQVANEKIMAVDEFSKQILERLDKNNSDVMFLYNMVTETKEELKTEIANAKKVEESLRLTAEVHKEERKAAAEAELTKVLATENGSAGAKKEALKPANTRTAKKSEPTKKAAEKKIRELPSVDDISELLAATVREIEEEEVNPDLPKDKILELHKQGKSIREISRELGKGQGEVKLVIDLYGA
ncbi:MAG: hypothetical protein IJW37_07925 [Lachnospiraceae bacterium]|nr:hypothetical protein [Lachnospiraceae bacterium]